MMGGATPRSTAADENGVFGLMAFLSDPAGCAARLQELQVAKQAARDAETAAAARANVAAESEATLAANVDAARADFDKTEDSRNRATLALDALATREVELATREAAVVAREAAATQAESDQADRVSALNLREEAIAAGEARIATTEDKIKAKLELFENIAKV